MIETNKTVVRGTRTENHSLRDVVHRRNHRLHDLMIRSLAEDGIEDIRLIGDEQNPAVIYKNEFCLSCYVKNFDLYLKDSDTKDGGEGNIMHVIKLTADLDDEIIDKVREWYACSNHRYVHRIELGNSGLFLSGYNFLIKKKSEGKYPVFSKYKSKIYFTKTRAEEILKECEIHNHNLIIR